MLKLPRPTPGAVRQLHESLIRDWTRRIRKDEELRDLVHQKNKIEILPESTERNMAPIEIHCVDVETPVLTRDLRWVRAGDLQVGDALIGFEEEPHGDAHHRHRNFRDTTVTHVSTEVVEGYVVTLENGEQLRTTGEHQFLSKRPSDERITWRRVDEMYEALRARRGGTPAQFTLPKYFDTWRHDTSWTAGYLAGAFDADGTLILGEGSGLTVKLVQLDNELLAEVRSSLTKLGFAHSPSFEDDLPNGKRYCFGEHVRGGFEETMRFLGTVRPPRLLSRWSRFDLSKHKTTPKEHLRIVSIERAEVKIAKLSSSSATYFSAGFASHNSGRAGGIIDHANGLLMATPTWHVDPVNLTTEAKRDAEIIERALATIYVQQLIGNDFWPSCGRDVLIYARGFLKTMPLASVWTVQEGYPVRNARENAKDYLNRIRDWKEREAKFPFIIQHVSAISILAQLDNNDHVIATIEEKWVTARVLADEMGSEYIKELIDRGALRWYDELPVVEYIDAEWVGYFLSGTEPRRRDEHEYFFNYRRTGAYKQLRVWRHNLGKHPVTMIPGIRTELPELDMHFKSFLADAKDALETYDFLLSRLATMVYAYYLPSYEWQLAASSAQFAGRDRPSMTVNLGGVTVTYADENLRVLPFPTGLPDANMLLQQVDDVIQRHTLEDVLFGRVAGSAPAFQVHLRINVAKSKLTPIAQHMAIGLTNAGEMFLRSIVQLGEAVIIGGEKVTVAMAKAHVDRITVAITPKSPADRNQDIGAAAMALQFGLPWDWIVENILDIEDPATLRLQKDILEIEDLPQVKERLMADALDQLEALIEDEEYEDAEGIDLDALPPEFAAALQGLLGTDESADIESILAGAGVPGPNTGGEEVPSGVGRGPYPPGAAPQSLQGGRGLTTQRTQPSPTSPMVDTALAGLPPGALRMPGT